MAALHRLVTATSSTLELEEVLDALLDNLRSLSGADRVGVMLLDPRTDLLTAAASRDADGALPVGLRLARGEGAAGRVIEDTKPLLLPDIRAFPQFAAPYGAPAAAGVPRALSYAGFPLVSRGRVLGVVSLVGTRPRDFSSDETNFFETLCRAAAVSIDNALAHQQLQHRADRLTDEFAIHRSYAENVLGSITDGVATIDKNRRIASWNRGAEAILGYPAERVVGAPCDDIFGKVDAAVPGLCHGPGCAFDEIQRTGRAWPRREVWSTRHDGGAVALNLGAAPIVDEHGDFHGLVTVFYDASHERALLDGIQSASQAKSRFLANISHEIRTPLNAILGFSQILLKDAELPARYHQHLDAIARSGEHLLALIDDILTMAKVDAGRAQVAPSSFNLRALLVDVGGMFRLRAEGKGLGFAVHVAPRVPARVRTDERKLRQILINLIGNAVKFTLHGHVRCEINFDEGAGRAPRLVVEVEDTGPGVSAREAEAIFRPFEQTAAGAVAGGTGLGLAISREYARLMGGDLTVVSEVGRGSCFRLTLPVSLPDGDERDAGGVVAAALAGGMAGSADPPVSPPPPLRVPSAAADALRSAAARADYARILEIVDGLAGTAPEAATALRAIVERFDYAGLLERVAPEAAT